MKKAFGKSGLTLSWALMAALVFLSGCGPHQDAPEAGDGSSVDSGMREPGSAMPPSEDDEIDRVVSGANAQNEIADSELHRLQQKFGISEENENHPAGGAPYEVESALRQQLKAAREDRDRLQGQLDTMTRERVDLDGELNRLKQQLENAGAPKPE